MAKIKIVLEDTGTNSEVFIEHDEDFDSDEEQDPTVALLLGRAVMAFIDSLCITTQELH